MNKVILLGRLTKDPDLRSTNTGKSVCQFNLAVDRPFTSEGGQREADFIPVVIWGKSAETAGKSLTKGQRALVEGRLQVRSYDGKDGVKRYVTEVIADRFEFIERKADVQNHSSGYNQGSEQVAPFESMGKVIEPEIPF